VKGGGKGVRRKPDPADTVLTTWRKIRSQRRQRRTGGSLFPTYTNIGEEKAGDQNRDTAGKKPSASSSALRGAKTDDRRGRKKRRKHGGAI